MTFQRTKVKKKSQIFQHQHFPNTVTALPNDIERIEHGKREGKKEKLRRIFIFQLQEDFHENNLYRIINFSLDFRSYENDVFRELLENIKSSGKHLLKSLIFISVYVILIALLLFYIENCSGATPSKDSTSFNQRNRNLQQNIENACRSLFLKIKNLENNSISNNNISSDKNVNLTVPVTFLKDCEDTYLSEKAVLTCSLDGQMMLRYCELVVFTLLTIGRTTSPTTIAGQQFFIVCGLIGVPIMFYVLVKAGELCAQILELGLRKLFHKKLLIREKAIQTALFCLSVVSLIVFIVTVSGISSYMEDWNFTMGFYYWAVSLMTNGFPAIGFVKSNFYAQFFMKMSILFGFSMVFCLINQLPLLIKRCNIKIEDLCEKRTGRKISEMFNISNDLNFDNNNINSFIHLPDDKRYMEQKLLNQTFADKVVVPNFPGSSTTSPDITINKTLSKNSNGSSLSDPKSEIPLNYFSSENSTNCLDSSL